MLYSYLGGGGGGDGGIVTRVLVKFCDHTGKKDNKQTTKLPL